jgi:SAM-dependent methyltransferase
MGALRPLRRLRGALDRLYGRGEAAFAGFVLNHRYGMPAEAARQIELGDLSYSAEGRKGYGPSPWGVLRRVISPREVSEGDVFLDIGCGMGVVLLEAARHYSFRRVLGVEIVERFADIARNAVERNQQRLHCRSVEVITADALEYEIPADVSVVYMANPLVGDLLDTVIEQVTASVDANPRTLHLIHLSGGEKSRLDTNDRLEPVRYGRAGIRRWRRAPYLRLYRVVPQSVATPVKKS